MASIDQLERKVLELERQLDAQAQEANRLMAKSNKVLEMAKNAYKLDGYGFIWAYDPNTEEYHKTNMRVMSPELVDEAVKTRHLADGAVTGEKIAADAIDSSKIKDKTIEGRSIKADAIGTEQIKDQSITGDPMEPGAVPNGKLANNAVSERTIQDRAVTATKIALGALGPQHFTPKSFAQTIAPYFAELQHQIDAHSDHGGFVSDSFGSDPYVAVSQKAITEALHNVWNKIEDMNGEPRTGIIMSATHDYYVSEEGCDVKITVRAMSTPTEIERIEFYVGDYDTPMLDDEGNPIVFKYVDSQQQFTYHIDDDTLILCKAWILGIEYKANTEIKRLSEFFLGTCQGGADTEALIENIKEYVIVPENSIDVKDNSSLRVAKDVDCADDDHIVIVVEKSHYNDKILRMDMNGMEIDSTPITLVKNNTEYIAYVSDNTFNLGTYNIDING